MKPAVVLSINYLLTLTFFFAWIGVSFSCDTRWIRLMFMLSCGHKKKRASSLNDTFFENLPQDFEGALRYLRNIDPSNPIFSSGTLLLGEILEDKGERSPLQSFVLKVMINESEPPSNTTSQRSSVLLQKLLRGSDTKKGLGLRGLPDQWDLAEIREEKINENYRRELDKIIEECCKIPPVRTCNGQTFAGACK